MIIFSLNKIHSALIFIYLLTCILSCESRNVNSSPSFEENNIWLLQLLNLNHEFELNENKIPSYMMDMKLVNKIIRSDTSIFYKFDYFYDGQPISKVFKLSYSNRSYFNIVEVDVITNQILRISNSDNITLADMPTKVNKEKIRELIFMYHVKNDNLAPKFKEQVKKRLLNPKIDFDKILNLVN